jgi:hypothetical protein
LCGIKEDKSKGCVCIKEGEKATKRRIIGKSPKIRHTN